MSAALPTKDPCIGGKRRKRPGGPPYSSRLATQTVAEFFPRRSKPNLDKSERTIKRNEFQTCDRGKSQKISVGPNFGGRTG